MLRGFFKSLARVQARYYRQIVALTIIITVFQIYGATFMHMETDFSKFQPPTEPAVILNDRVQDTFAGQDSIFLVIELDPDIDSDNAVKDIRDPRVVKMLKDLGDEILQDPAIDSVFSVGARFPKDNITDDIDEMIDIFNKYPASGQFFNRDYTATMAIVRANIGGANIKAQKVIDAIEEDIEQTPKPPGIKITMTGGPSIRVLVADIIKTDAVKTILISSAIIFVILILVQGSIIRGLLVFNPLMYALLWTIGTMGWANIPLSIITAGLGAMILGLGVEYSIFLVSKYEMEREKGLSQEDSIFNALDEVGTAIVGSSTTTMIGFLALLLSIMPMMHDLGTTLALGIFFCVISSLVINPAFIIFEENIWQKFLQNLMCKTEDKG